MDAALASAEVAELSKNLGVPVVGLYGSEAVDLLNSLDSVTTWTLFNSGVTQVDPSTLGIPEP